MVLPPGGTRGEALQQAGPLPNVGGQRSGHNIYLLDGVKITDELYSNLVINPSVDAIEEFKIQKSMYPAEFGGKASALINVAPRSCSPSARARSRRLWCRVSGGRSGRKREISWRVIRVFSVRRC